MKVLFVDAGNYCRSPVAEIVARSISAKGGLNGWQFGSAGLKDKHVGDSADPRSVEACTARGYDLSAFRCRQITERDFEIFDLVLAMDRENQAQLESLRPVGVSTPIKLFLGDREVPDPYYGGQDGFIVMMDLIEAGVRELVASVK